MAENEPQEIIPLTEEDRRLADEIQEQLERDLAEAAKRPDPPPGSVRYDRFTGPIGLRDDGSLQPPLTEEEKRHNEEVRQRAREEARQARERPANGD